LKIILASRSTYDNIATQLTTKLKRGLKVMTKITDIITAMNTAPSGSFVGITDYMSTNGDVISVTGHIGFDYDRLKTVNEQRLQAIIDADEFEPITVKGSCFYDTAKGEWNSRKRTMPFKDYEITFSAKDVKETAEAILAKMQEPAKPRKSNKTNLTEKANGLALYNETGNFNFMLLVENETYKAEASAEAKEGLEVKPKAKMPQTALNEAIKALYERKLKSFTIAEGKFKGMTIAGKKFESDRITL
jgi:hypothetical protein